MRRGIGGSSGARVASRATPPPLVPFSGSSATRASPPRCGTRRPRPGGQTRPRASAARRRGGQPLKNNGGGRVGRCRAACALSGHHRHGSHQGERGGQGGHRGGPRVAARARERGGPREVAFDAEPRRRGAVGREGARRGLGWCASAPAPRARSAGTPLAAAAGVGWRCLGACRVHPTTFTSRAGANAGRLALCGRRVVQGWAPPPPRNRPPLRQVPSVLVIGALAGERRPAPPRARLTFSGGVFEPRRRAPRALLVPPHRGPPTLPRPRNTRSAAARSPRPAAHPPRAASAARRRALRPSRALAAVNGEPPRPRPPSEAVCTFVGTDPRWAGGAPPPRGPSRFARPPVLFPPLRPSPPTPQCPPTAARA
jgi:hypothetical protein